MPGMILRLTCAAAVLGMIAAPVQATWSIILCDSETKEVATGTVTCLTNYDLLAIVPVVVVGKGAGAVQSAGDFAGIRRPIIFDQLMLGTPPEQILIMLQGISGHQSRQYGIVDTTGGAITFSGSQNGAWAGGMTGTQGTMHYAIQGNVLAGSCVVDAIEQAVLDTPGDLPAKLMAGMEAARAMGGDGRCSCSQSNPPGCGCPVPSFTKAGHIGGMVVARPGDIDDPVCNASGCADGDYFMRFNVAYQNFGAPDPVHQLQDQFDAWRANLIGRPDAGVSTVGFEPPLVPPNGVSETTMHVALLDWQGAPITQPIQSLTVVHAPDSAGLSMIGEVIDLGGGAFTVELTAGTEPGIDRFIITADDGVRPVQLMPNPSLRYFAPGDVNGDGVVDVLDLLILLGDWGPCAVCPSDVNGDGTVDVLDLLALLGNWG